MGGHRFKREEIKKSEESISKGGKEAAKKKKIREQC